MWDYYNDIHKIKGGRLVTGAVTRCPLQIWSTTCHKSYRAWWRVDAATALAQLRQVKAEVSRQIQFPPITNQLFVHSLSYSSILKDEAIQSFKSSLGSLITVCI
jgi:hypothetical protein